MTKGQDFSNKWYRKRVTEYRQMLLDKKAFIEQLQADITVYRAMEAEYAQRISKLETQILSLKQKLVLAERP